MSFEQDYATARQWIEDRELSEDHLTKAEDLLLRIVETDKSQAKAWGMLCEVLYWKGEVATEKKLEIYQKGVEYGEKGTLADPQNIEATFWLSVCYGLYGQERGIMTSLFLISPIEKLMKKSLEIDEGFFFGGPHRAMGRFYHQVPPWPIASGDNRKALAHLQKSLEFGPEFYLNHIYIAEIYLSLGDKKKAREHIDWILNAPLTPKHEKEDGRYKEAAKLLLPRT